MKVDISEFQDRILDGLRQTNDRGDRDNSPERDTHNEMYWLDVETEDIYYAYPSAMVLNDIFKTVGTMQDIYGELIHPCITMLYNGLDGDYDRLCNLERDDEIADRTYDFLESRYYLYRTIEHKDKLKVEPDDVILLCKVIMEIILPRIVEYTNNKTDDYIRDEIDMEDVHIMIQLDERCKVQSIPSPRNPNILKIGVSCFVVHT